jgi:hypothetical protein
MKLNKIGKIYGKTFGNGLSGHTVYAQNEKEFLEINYTKKNKLWYYRKKQKKNRKKDKMIFF